MNVYTKVKILHKVMNDTPTVKSDMTAAKQNTHSSTMENLITVDKVTKTTTTLVV